jgi:phosphoglycerate dehydrogenase-like enzyme
MMTRKRVLFTFTAPPDFMREVSQGFEENYEFVVARTRREAVELCSTAEVLVMNAPMSDVIAGATSCSWIHVIGAGVDSYLAIDRVRNSSSLLLTNSSGIFGTQVSEHVFALLLGLTRGVKQDVLFQKNRHWMEEGDRDVTEMEIYGKNITIVGLGDVGLQVAKRASAFGLIVTGVKKSTGELKNPDYVRYLDKVVSVEDLNQVLGNSDIVVDALPLTSETMRFFNRETFLKMKTGAAFLNVGRGLTVDEQALIDAIKVGKLGLVGLDVFASEPLPKNSPLWEFDNVIISPHRAGRSRLLYSKAVPLLRENLTKYIRGEPLTNSVNKTRGY